MNYNNKTTVFVDIGNKKQYVGTSVKMENHCHLIIMINIFRTEYCSIIFAYNIQKPGQICYCLCCYGYKGLMFCLHQHRYRSKNEIFCAELK